MKERNVFAEHCWHFCPIISLSAPHSDRAFDVIFSR